MSADLYLHDLGDTPLRAYLDWRDYDDLEEATLLAVKNNEEAWEAIGIRNRERKRLEKELNPAYSDQAWIGSMNWSITDPSKNVPGAVYRIRDIFHDAPILTRALIAETMVAMSLPRGEIYRRLEKPRYVKTWLTSKLGHHIYPIAW